MRSTGAPSHYPRMCLVVLLLSAGGVATVYLTGGNPRDCGGNVACQLSTGNVGALLHQLVALFLVLAVIVLWLVSLFERREHPGRIVPSVLCVVFVLITAAWGAALATGALPLSLAPGVLVWLLLLGACVLWGWAGGTELLTTPRGSRSR